jgi:hypothetical protein
MNCPIVRYLVQDVRIRRIWWRKSLTKLRLIGSAIPRAPARLPGATTRSGVWVGPCRSSRGARSSREARRVHPWSREAFRRVLVEGPRRLLPAPRAAGEQRRENRLRVCRMAVHCPTVRTSWERHKTTSCEPALAHSPRQLGLRPLGRPAGGDVRPLTCPKSCTGRKWIRRIRCQSRASRIRSRSNWRIAAGAGALPRAPPPAHVWGSFW